jgi:hypothetical protein
MLQSHSYYDHRYTEIILQCRVELDLEVLQVHKKVMAQLRGEEPGEMESEG